MDGTTRGAAVKVIPGGLTEGVGGGVAGNAGLESRRVLGMRVDATSLGDASRRVLRWAAEGRSSYVCVANVHMAMEASDRAGYRGVVNGADLVVPDGMPLVWSLKAMGAKGVSRVRGADLMLRVAEGAAREGVPVGLFGGSPETLERLARRLEERFPDLRLACEISPPFRPATPEEDGAHVREISRSGARVLFVGLGCPKQERWMAAHRGRVPAAMVGVGAAFDFHAGRVKEAPRWMQAAGLEWLFRLCMEPRRLWRRYLLNNPRFVVSILAQLVGGRGRRRGRGRAQ